MPSVRLSGLAMSWLWEREKVLCPLEASRGNVKQHGDLAFPIRTYQDQVYERDRNLHKRHRPHTAAGTCSPNPVSSSSLGYLETPLGCSLRTRPQGLRRKRELECQRTTPGGGERGELYLEGYHSRTSCRALRVRMCHQGAVPTLSEPPHTCFCIAVLSRTCY